jgi:hypothetical protein
MQLRELIATYWLILALALWAVHLSACASGKLF